MNNGKYFIPRVLLFVLAALLLFGGVVACSGKEPLRSFLTDLTDSGAYGASASEEILPHIANVQQPSEATRLIVGDSVCWQVFDPFNLCNTDYRIDGTNRALTLAGQYLLVQQFLQSHPAATDVYLVLTPASFSAGFDAGYGYQYLAAPFGRADLLQFLDADTKAELSRAYGALCLTPRFTAWLDTTPLGKKLYLNALPEQSDAPGALSPMAARSIQAMNDLCAQSGAALHLVAAPLADTEAMHTAMTTLAQAFADAGLYEEYAAYFTQALWYDAALFNEDGIHFDSALADMDFLAGVVRDLQGATGAFGGIVLSYD